MCSGSAKMLVVSWIHMCIRSENESLWKVLYMSYFHRDVYETNNNLEFTVPKHMQIRKCQQEKRGGNFDKMHFWGGE